MVSVMEYVNSLILQNRKRREEEQSQWFAKSRKRSRERMVMAFEEDLNIFEAFTVSRLLQELYQ